MKTYIYPENLKASAKLWLWDLRDFTVTGVGLLVSVFCIAHTGILIPAAAVLLYGFLSIRLQDTSIRDFIIYAAKHLILTQQYYVWRDGFENDIQ